MTANAAETCAFLDEYGNVDVDVSKKDVTTHFVVAAVVVPATEVDRLRRSVDAVRQEHCGSGELKSKKLAKNPDRYKRVLEDLARLPFLFSALAVDKREVNPQSGLIYGQSFYKFLQRIVYRDLLSTYSQLSVMADEYGSEEFMAGFREYIGTSTGVQLDLFARVQLSFVRSESEPLVQLADVIAGLIGRALDAKRKPNPFVDLLPTIRPRGLTVEEWPTPRLRTSKAATVPEDDAAVAALSSQRAESFLARKAERAEGDELAQVRVLKKFLFETSFGDPRRFVPTGEILDDLEAFMGFRSSEQWLRSNVIAAMRDAGVLIASSPKGYLVPTALADLRSFVDHADRVIGPMLKRLKLARDAVLAATHKQVDILAGDEYQLLTKAVEVLDFFQRRAIESSDGDEAL